MRTARPAILLALFAVFTITSLAAFPRQAAPESRSVVDISLDGTDWRMGSFGFGAGIEAGAASETFDDGGFRTVTVPGDTQLQAGFTGSDRFRESKELMSVNMREWWYRKHFRAAARVAGKVTRLVFDGSDYFTTVWLNGRLLGTHEGTYTPFSFDVTNQLRYGADNVLAVVVTHPWVPKDRALDEYLAGNFSMSVGVRVTGLPYHFGVSWDGLPAQGNATIPMGIWRSVHLRVSAPLTISDLHVETKSINADGSALLHVSATVENATAETQSRKVQIVLKPENFAGTVQEIPALAITAAPGQTTVAADVRVANAKLWWSWDKGPQNLYELEARIVPQDGGPGDGRGVRFGIRTVSRDADMGYHLNGQKVFIKASWFPIEDFYRSTPTPADYERDLRLFRNANFNLLVNFTVVEKPEFYDLCDELGILLVVEMPFPQFGPQHVLDKDSPRREPFLKQARLQVTQIITTLRNHPSVVEWAPLAEARDKTKGGKWGAWSDGPWAPYDQEGYDVFVAEMNAIVSEFAPGTIFHASLCDMGEQHYWTAGQTWDTGFYSDFFEADGGFISEYGTISLSSYENLRKYLTPDEQWGRQAKSPRSWFGLPIDPTAYASWTANGSGGLYGMLYRSRRFIDLQPGSARELVEDTQLYQAFLLRYAAEAFRRKKYAPVNGIRSWDFLEVAPGFRFGIVDYDHVPKIAYWYMKQAQAPVAISFAYREALESQLAGSKWSVPIWVINDLEHEIRGTVHAELLTLGGGRVAAADYPVEVAADGKAIAGTFSLTLPQAAGVYVLRATLTGSDAGSAPVETTSFIKVVPAAFKGPHRVLLIAQSKFAAPIAKLLRAIGVEVDVYDENAVDAMTRDLRDGASVHSRYDAIWLGSFEYLGRVLPGETAKALRDAVELGTGFVHTGGEGSFHGGNGHAALIEASDLNAVLPVNTTGREDLMYGPHDAGDGLGTQHSMTDMISVGQTGADAAGISQEGLELLRQYGVPAFNQVSSRPGSKIQLSVTGEPLLVSGAWGRGKTVAFTGFTPQASDAIALPIDQYLMAEPQIRAYFVLFAELLADVLPGAQEGSRGLLSAHEKPLYQTLKEQPPTKLGVTKINTAQVDKTATRLRIRIENLGGYAHLVHMKVEWQGTGPKPYIAELSNNDFELLPNESREIKVEWRTSTPSQQAAGTVIVNAANSQEVRVTF